ncbi:chromosome partitioning protein ParB [Gordonibacter sp. 28C]|uniref:ParB/RepB/Spo0J family partition protein n=1 Tax=Gordonibacter sp. 28C TaxID=2078569 RepID=UPI000DF773A0|nr:ParB/RepB/Spo0J family partition protein [Gordonibacter sp. 28C]RDB64295.1 chromosome partitioning protein ParB [Gordonibacter sp. 28C]
METTKIPLNQCIESKLQNRTSLGDVSGLARSIEVNGQITPLIVVADGETYQLVAGHRRTAAMKKLGLEEADAYVMDGWDDARIARVLNAENNHRKDLTEAERGQGIQTMLSLGVPVADAAVSADVDEGKAEAYVRGSKLVPVDAVNLDFDAVALIGEYDDVLTEDDVVKVFSKTNPWDRLEVCRKARGRANKEALAEKLSTEGIKVVERADVEGMHWCDGECGHDGMVAVVSTTYYGEASASYYCDDAEHVHEPSAEEVAAEEAFQKRTAAYDELREHATGFAKSIYPKFPGKGHTKLRQWAHEAFEARYGCEADDAWADVKEPRGKALDQFVLMRTVPECVPELPWGALRDGFEPSYYSLDDLLGFVSFVDDILVPAGYEPTSDELEVMEHLHGMFSDEDGEATGEAFEPADAEADEGDEPPFDADEIVAPAAMAA